MSATKESVQPNEADLPKGTTANEFDKEAIVARYGKDGMTYFTGEFTPLGEGIFSKCPNKE